MNFRGGFGPLATVSLPLSVKKGSCKRCHKMEKIGWIHPNNQVSSQDEAVISFSITPLANLVQEEKLRRSMQEATRLYIRARLHIVKRSESVQREGGRGGGQIDEEVKRLTNSLPLSDGPYYIMTPEKTLGGKNIYWKVKV